MSEVIYCHYEDIDGVRVPLDTPAVFSISNGDRARFDEFAESWGERGQGVTVTDLVTNEVLTVWTTSCGLNCECAAIFKRGREVVELDRGQVQTWCDASGILTVGKLREILAGWHDLTQVVIADAFGYWNISDIELPDNDNYCAVTLFAGSEVSPIQF